MEVQQSGGPHQVAAGAVSDRVQRRPIDVADILTGLSTSQAEAVTKMTNDRRHSPGTYIYRLGEHQQGLYLAKVGLVEEFRLTDEGNRLTINRIVPGQLFGLSSVKRHYCCFAEAIEECVVGLLSFEKLEKVCRDFPRVGVNLVKLLSGRLGEIEDRVELLAFSGLRARVAWALLGLSVVHGHNP